MSDIKYIENGAGIGAYCYYTDRFKSENISVYLTLPTSREDSVKRSLFLSVLKRGTKSLPTQKEINIKLDELYATLVSLKNQKFDDTQLLGISADIIDSAYTENGEDLMPEVLNLLAEILHSPKKDGETGRFCEEFVKSEKENYKSIILSQINEPRTYAAIRCREEMFAELGIFDKLDTMCEKIDGATTDEIYEVYTDAVENAGILAFYVGKRSPGEVMAQLEGAFSPKRHKKCRAATSTMPRLATRCTPKEVIESADVTQGRLVMGYNSGITWRDEDYYATLLCNEILGASPISKLMVNVREKLSLCYECSSVYNSARGAIIVTTGIDTENYELARGAIEAQLDDIKNGSVSEQELLAAKKSIYNIYNAVSDSPNAIERFYLGRIINGIDASVSDFLKKIEALSLDDVINAAKKLELHTVYFLKGERQGEGESDEI